MIDKILKIIKIKLMKMKYFFAPWLIAFASFLLSALILLKERIIFYKEPINIIIFFAMLSWSSIILKKNIKKKYIKKYYFIQTIMGNIGVFLYTEILLRKNHYLFFYRVVSVIVILSSIILMFFVNKETKNE